MDVRDVRADLIAEHHALDDIVAGLRAEQWHQPTASPRWTVADQIGHLTFFDRTAALALTDPDAFAAATQSAVAAMVSGPDAADEFTLGEFRAMTPAELLTAWRDGRAALVEASSELDPTARVPWYGPAMGPTSFITARLMETWAHGQDVVDAVGADRPPTARLRHIAQLGVLTRGWSYRNRRLPVPETPVRVELTAPDGQRWTYGDPSGAEAVLGPALDFCLVVTQRRHVDDTSLVTDGPAARDWMEKAQAFAGAATDGPAPNAAGTR